MAIIIRTNPAVFQARKNMRIQQDLMDHVLHRLEKRNSLQKREGSHLLRNAHQASSVADSAIVQHDNAGRVPESIDARSGASLGTDAAGEFSRGLNELKPLSEPYAKREDARIVLLEQKSLGGPRGVGFGISPGQQPQGGLNRSTDEAGKEDLRTFTLRGRELNETLSALEIADRELENISQVVSRMHEMVDRAATVEMSPDAQSRLNVLREELVQLLDSSGQAFGPGVLGLTEPEALENEQVMAAARLNEAVEIIHQSRGTIAASKYEVDVAIRNQGAAAVIGKTEASSEEVSGSSITIDGVVEQILNQPEVATLSQANGLSTAAMRLLG